MTAVRARAVVVRRKSKLGYFALQSKGLLLLLLRDVLLLLLAVELVLLCVCRKHDLARSVRSKRAASTRDNGQRTLQNDTAILASLLPFDDLCKTR